MRRFSIPVLIATAAALAACQQEPASEINAAEEPASNVSIIPKPRPPIGRASLLTAVAEASSATAAGAEMPESVRSLDGRQFEIRIRFGCRGPVTDFAERWLGWTFDSEQRRIRVRATPTLSGDDPLIQRIGSERVEAVEGFWIPRPWLLEPVCPAGAAVQSRSREEQQQSADEDSTGQQQARREQPDAGNRAESDESSQEPQADPVGEPVPTAPRIGIAQFFTREDPRSRRRNMRPYQSAYTLKEGEALSSQGYNLVLSGRLRALPGQGVINCIASGADLPPECVVSAEFLRVWIEKPDTREVIAEWGGG